MTTNIMGRARAALCAVLLLAASATLAQTQVLYGALAGPGPLGIVEKAGTSNLLILNPATGAVLSSVGPIGYAVTGLAIHPTTGQLYGSTSRQSINSPHSLIRIDKTTGAGTLVGTFNQGTQTLADITFTADGTLYGWLEASADSLYTVNLTTGAATLIGASGLSTSGSGLAADAAGVLYYAGSGASGALRTINRTTGAATVVATLNGSPAPADASIGALAFSPAGVLYGVHIDTDNNISRLITINTATGAITNLGVSANDLDAIVFDGAAAPPPPPPPNLPVPVDSPAMLVLLALLLAAAATLVPRLRG